MLHFGSLQGLRKQTLRNTCFCATENLYWNGIRRIQSSLPALPCAHCGTRRGAALAQQPSPEPSTSHPACLHAPTAATRAAQSCSGGDRKNPDTAESSVCRCGHSPKPGEAELVLSASGNLVRRGTVYSDSSLNGTHRTAQKVGKHLLSRSWQVKPGRKEQ